MAAGAVQDWVKNIKDRLLVKQRLSRNRERKIVRLEGEEERLDRDIVEVNMDIVEVNRKSQELKFKKVQLMTTKIGIIREKQDLRELEVKGAAEVTELIRQKEGLKEALQRKNQAKEQKMQELEVFMRETLVRKELSLECPVCMEVAEAPIYCCR